MTSHTHSAFTSVVGPRCPPRDRRPIDRLLRRGAPRRDAQSAASHRFRSERARTPVAGGGARQRVERRSFGTGNDVGRPPDLAVHIEADLHVGIGTSVPGSAEARRPLCPFHLISQPRLEAHPDARPDLDERRIEAGDGRRVAEEHQVGNRLAAGEVAPTTRAPLRVSHPKNGAEPDAACGRLRSTSPADRSRESRYSTT